MNLYIDYDGIACYQNDDGVYIVVVENDILKYLLCRLMSYVPMYGVKHSYNEKFTVRSFFKLLGNYPLLKKLDNCIDVFIEECKSIEKCAIPDKNIVVVNKIHKTVYEQHTEVRIIDSNYDMKKTSLAYFQEHAEIIEYYPIEKYSDCPIVFGNDFVAGSCKNTICSITFIEFLKAMIDNICICGSSKGKLEFIERLKSLSENDTDIDSE